MRTYNGAPAHTVEIPAGTELWRVHRTDSEHPANSFNSTKIAPLAEALTIDPRRQRIPRQGRFDPVHDETICPGGSSLGGYLYVGLTIGAVVAEGILRSIDIPKTGIISCAALAELSLTRMTLHEYLTVATLDTQAGLAAINQDASLTGCTWREYAASRVTCTNILVATPMAQGARYRSRHGFDELSLLLVDRGKAPDITVDGTGRLDRAGWAMDLIEDSLCDDFGVVLDQSWS